MATGAPDEQGVWRYGEDDDLYPFSQYMDLGMSSVSAAFEADRDRLAEIEEKLDNVLWTRLPASAMGPLWSQLQSEPWENVWYARKAGMVTITGAIIRASGTPVPGETVLTMPVGLRPGKSLPVFTAPALQLVMRPDGRVTVLQAATVPNNALALTVTFPVA